MAETGREGKDETAIGKTPFPPPEKETCKNALVLPLRLSVICSLNFLSGKLKVTNLVPI